MAQKPEVIGREILPIPDIPSKGKMAMDARNAEFPAYKPLRPPKGAPNVVIVLIDDMGFGAPSVTGGPCHMPAMQKYRRRRPALQPFPHHRALLAHTSGPDDRAQPPLGRYGLGGRSGYRRAGQRQRATQQRIHHRRDAETQRL